MKALTIDSAGDAPRLIERELPTPELGPRDVLVRVAACGVCHHDVAVADGTLRRGVKPGVALGHEIAGVVEAVGADARMVGAGDRVVAALTAFCGECGRCAAGDEYRCETGHGFGHGIDGGFAQYVRMPERAALPLIPGLRDMDARLAALLACPIGVAVNAVEDAARLRAGETALVVGAGGGLGVHLAQVAAAVGARVIAVTTSERKAGALAALPGVEVVVADDADGGLDFSEIAMALTDDVGVDAAFNPVGSAMFGSCLASLARRGRMVALGEVAGRAARFNAAELVFRDARIIGCGGASPRHIRRAMELAAGGRVKPVASEDFAFGGVGDAMRRMRGREIFGRATLTPPG